MVEGGQLYWAITGGTDQIQKYQHHLTSHILGQVPGELLYMLSYKSVLTNKITTKCKIGGKFWSGKLVMHALYTRWYKYKIRISCLANVASAIKTLRPAL